MARHPQIGDVIAEKYRIDAELGRGGMGTVFSATHLMTGRRFALKWMNVDEVRDHEGRERFIREFQTSGSIVHVNVRAVLDVGTLDDSLYIVMEYLEGESLAAMIARGPMLASECVPIILDAMQGVAAAHERDIVHRDLKPDNIFLCHSPGRLEREIKVLDFGIVKAINARAQFLPTITARGTTVGTPPYMAPEQVMALPTIDHRADIYAFGVILYEALSGTLPFYETSRVRLAERIVKGHAPPLSQRVGSLPAGLEAVVMRALEREPSARYASLTEFATALVPWAPSGARYFETPWLHGPAAVFGAALPPEPRFEWRSAVEQPAERRRPSWTARTERSQPPVSQRADARSLWLAVLVLITGLVAALAVMRAKQPSLARRSAPVETVAPSVLRPAPQPPIPGPGALPANGDPNAGPAPVPAAPSAAVSPGDARSDSSVAGVRVPDRPAPVAAALPSPPPSAAGRAQRERAAAPGPAALTVQPRAAAPLPRARPRAQPSAAAGSEDVRRSDATGRAKPATSGRPRKTSGVSLADF